MIANDWRLPPEWVSQDAVMITWPHAATDWAPLLAQAERVYIDVVRAITRFQPILIVAHNEPLQAAITARLQQADIDMRQVQLAVAPCDDTWARDHGPLTLIDSQHAATRPLDFTFNGWGNKFIASQDNAINQRLAGEGWLSAPLHTIDMVLEGGAIEVDGNGSLLTTSACLLNPNRNPSLNRDEIEMRLRQCFNVQQVLWLDYGAIAGDDTDSHIDTLARFAPARTIVYQGCNQADDPHYSELARMAEQLKTFTDVAGHPYRLLALPWPAAKYDEDGERLPATYANFLVINDAVLVPTYQDANDDGALAVISQAFPDREVIGIDCLPLIEQAGSLHCITMQLPAGTLTSKER